MTDTKTTLTWLLRDQVSGAAKGIENALDKTGLKAKSSNSLLGQLGSALGGMVTPFSLAAAGATALVGGLAEAMKKGAEEQVNINRLNAALKANVPGWNGNTNAIEKMIAKREDLAFSDDELRDSLGTLVASTKDVTQAQDLQSLAMDLARLKHVDLATASEALAKANAGSTRELKALGIEVDDSKDKTQVFAAIQKAAAGQAEAFAKTSAGRWETLQNKIGDLVETVGQLLLPIFDTVVTFLSDDVIPVVQGVADVFGPILGGAIDIVSKAIRWWVDNVIKPAIDKIAGLIGFVKDALHFLGILQDTPPPEAPAQTGHQWASGEKRAAGGPVEPGMTYTVGENGPETLVMGRQGGSIIPNGSGMVPVEIPVMLDGREIGRIADERLFYALRSSAPMRGRA